MRNELWNVSESERARGSVRGGREKESKLHYLLGDFFVVRFSLKTKLGVQ